MNLSSLQNQVALKSTFLKYKTQVGAKETTFGMGKLGRGQPMRLGMLLLLPLELSIQRALQTTKGLPLQSLVLALLRLLLLIGMLRLVLFLGRRLLRPLLPLRGMLLLKLLGLGLVS